MILWFCPFRWCESNVIGLSSAPQMVEVLCCWDLWWKMFSLSLNEVNPLYCWFLCLWARSSGPSSTFAVWSSQHCRIISLPVASAAQSWRAVWSISPSKHWRGVSCCRYHVSLLQWWKAPGESKPFLAHWGAVSTCAWLGLSAAIGRGFFVDSLKQKENASLLPQILHH